MSQPRPRVLIEETPTAVTIVEPDTIRVTAVGIPGPPGRDGGGTDLGYQTATEHGAIGDGVADDTAAVQAAIDAAKVNRGVVYLEPGKVYQTRGLTIDESDVTVIAYGATIIHSGDNEPLVTLGGAGGAAGTPQRIHWHGGTLRAKPSTTNPTTALMFIKSAWRLLIEGVELAGGDDTNTNRYATYGLWIEGRQNQSTYWSTVIQPHIHGCADAALFIDGWDPVNSPAVGNYTGAFTFVGPTIMQNGRGVVIPGTNFDQFYGGHIEANTGYGVEFGPFARDVGFWGVHAESNNTDTSNPQVFVDTSDAGNLGRNSFYGAVSTPPPDDQVRHLKFWVGTGNWTFGRTLRNLNNLDISRELAAQIATQYSVDGEAWPRVRYTAGGDLQYRDPANDVNSYFTPMKAYAMNDAGTDNLTVLRCNAGIRIGTSSSILKYHRTGTASLNFPSIPAGSTSELTIAVSNAAVGDSVTVTPNGSPPAGCVWCGWVSAAGVVTVRLANISTTSAIDPPAQSWRADCWQH